MFEKPSVTLSLFVFMIQPNLTSIPDSHSFCPYPKERFLSLSISNDTSEIEKVILLQSGDIEQNPGPHEGEDNLRIVHINARSLKNKITLFEIECNNFDVITISETWLSDRDDNAEILLPNFHPPIRNDRENDPHGGVAIYVRNNLSFKPRPDLNIRNLEAVWVEIKLMHEPLLIGSYYRPPNANNHYWELIEESINKVNDDFKKFVILGDFNTDWLKNPSRYLMNIIHLFNLNQLNHQPTRVTSTSSTCIDLVLTQCPDIISSVDVLPAFCSDHSVLLAILNYKSHRNFRFKRTIYNYEKLDNEKFQALLSLEDWNKIFTDFPIDVSCELFTLTFFEIAKQCMPSKCITVRSRDVPWLNAQIKNTLRLKNRLYKKAKKSKTVEDWNAYKSFRNKTTTEIKLRKQEYLSELNEIICNPQKFGNKEWWKIVNSFLSKKGIHEDEIPPLNFNGKMYYSNKEKADALNNFFIHQSTLEGENDELPELQFLPCELAHIEITSDEINTIILNLKLNKATGPDKIHNRLLKAAITNLSNPLSIFFNRCLREGRFPKSWKVANVIPLYKKGDKEQCNNYRPISLLSCVGKLFERCVYKHVYNYLISNNIITSAQSGFQTGDSTVYQLLSIYDNLCQNYDSATTTQSIFFDISKAFDRVWHKGLIHKLNSIGIRGNLLKWFKDYLTSRTQVVVLKNEMSDELPVCAGVPQGSVLGPMLFLIYINDITLNIQSIITLFADDTSISCSDKNNTVRHNSLSADLIQIEKWSKTWKVKFNDTKTHLLNFKRDNLPVHSLYFSDTQLVESSSHKHLGIILQNNCKWGDYISHTAARAKLLLNCLKSYKYLLSRKALHTMYTSFILPIFDYCDIIWDNCTQQQSQFLENLHLEGIRIITGLVRGTSHEILYKESGFCSLKERRKRHKLIMYFKILNGFAPSYLTSLLPPLISESNPYHRRRAFLRHIPRCRTDMYKNSFFPSTTQLWNSLPDHMQLETSLKSFKKFLAEDDTKVPAHYFQGTRPLQLQHCRLRNGMSDLNGDLVKRHLKTDPSCACGFKNESAEHFLLFCPLYALIRSNTILTIKDRHRTTNLLLFGSEELSLSENAIICAKVQEFIKKSKRFK